MRFAKIISMAVLPMFFIACSDENSSFDVTKPQGETQPQDSTKIEAPPNEEIVKPIERDYSLVWSGNGTAEDPYLISNEEDLAKIEFYVSDSSMTFKDTYFKQTADIALVNPWKPIGIFGKNAYGYGNRVFSGIYDGDNKKISGLVINDTASYSGLFGLTRGAHISNVVLVGAKIGVGSNAGALAGKMDSTTVENCVLENIEITGKDRVGGLVGEASHVNVSNVAVSGVVKGENSVGGIVGRLLDGSFENLVNKADVSGKSTVGGVAGSFAITVKSEEAGASNIGFIHDVLNYGSVSGTSNVAGVIASLSSAKADRVGNYGSVAGDEGITSNVAGVFAEASNKSVVNEAFNMGTVTSKKAMATGGVFGSLKNSTGKNVFNLGELSGQASNMGGIAGIIDGVEALLESGYNAGVVPNDNNSGTVAGKVSSTVTVTNVFYDKTVGTGCLVVANQMDMVLPTGYATEEMKAATFVTTLNGAGTAWTVDPTKFNGYPSFSWIK
jgi:hypothetical protein